MWLSGLSASLQTKRLLVWLPVKAHAWVAGKVPCWGCAKGNWYVSLTHWCFFLTLSLKIKSFKKIANGCWICQMVFPASMEMLFVLHFATAARHTALVGSVAAGGRTDLRVALTWGFWIPRVNTTWSWYIILLRHCWILFANILLRIFACVKNFKILLLKLKLS